MAHQLTTNTSTLESVLAQINALPDATSGVELPELSNPATAADALSGKEFIDADGNKVTGTIATKTASNLSASGATVTVPAGYYASQATKSVATATQATPNISVSSTGKITATSTQTAGYVTSGTKSATRQLSTQSGKTITPTKSQQTAVLSGSYTTGSVIVAKIPDKYQDVSGVTATAADVLSGASFVASDGTLTEGTITERSSSNLYSSGATVYTPAGYYASTASRAVSYGSVGNPSVSIDETGLVTADVEVNTGYVSGTTKTGELQLDTQAEATITPTKEAQTAVASGRYTTGAVTVAAIPDQYEDITTPLADLNTANGGTEATTMAAAVDNTEALASSQEALIAQIATALEDKAGGGEDVSAETAEYTDLLDDLESTINALPDGGSDGSVETCTVTVTVGRVLGADRIYYQTESGCLSHSLPTTRGESIEIQCVVPSFVFIYGTYTTTPASGTSGEIAMIVDGASVRVFYVTGNATIQSDGA